MLMFLSLLLGSSGLSTALLVPLVAVVRCRAPCGHAALEEDVDLVSCPPLCLHNKPPNPDRCEDREPAVEEAGVSAEVALVRVDQVGRDDAREQASESLGDVGHADRLCAELRRGDFCEDDVSNWANTALVYEVPEYSKDSDSPPRALRLGDRQEANEEAYDCAAVGAPVEECSSAKVVHCVERDEVAEDLSDVRQLSSQPWYS